MTYRPCSQSLEVIIDELVIQFAQREQKRTTKRLFKTLVNVRVKLQKMFLDQAEKDYLQKSPSWQVLTSTKI
jgi:hypothetical protein